MPKVFCMIGAGAAGFFGAFRCREHNADAEIIILEKSSKFLSKVRVSGGGRCNVTHNSNDIPALVKNYPRGEKELRSAFHIFNCMDTVRWFEDRGVKLKAENDGRMFPVTDSSETIIHCLTEEARRCNIEIRLNCPVKDLRFSDGKINVELDDEVIIADALLIASGGSPAIRGYDWLKASGHTIVPPVPSLFTFNMPRENTASIMGVSVQNAKIKIEGTKYQNSGPLLFTHWGMSGPAVLKLSSIAARSLAEKKYEFGISISWIDMKEDQLRAQLLQTKQSSIKAGNMNSFYLPARLWEFLLAKAEIDKNKNNLSNAEVNKLVNILLYDKYNVRGKTTFREEFVTCGGISLGEVDFRTMRSKIHGNLFFAGEVLDIDAVTGGFNFQAAWTTSFIAGSSMK
jgi:predicted Rossmann fold flavoprotein